MMVSSGSLIFPAATGGICDTPWRMAPWAAHQEEEETEDESEEDRDAKFVEVSTINVTSLHSNNGLVQRIPDVTAVQEHRLQRRYLEGTVRSYRKANRQRLVENHRSYRSSAPVVSLSEGLRFDGHITRQDVGIHRDTNSSRHCAVVLAAG